MGIKSSTRPRPRRSRSWPPTVSGIGGLGLCGALRRRRAAVVRAAGARGRRLGDQAARALLQSVIRAPLDDGVRDRIVAETRSNPLALLELPREVGNQGDAHRADGVRDRLAGQLGRSRTPDPGLRLPPPRPRLPCRGQSRRFPQRRPRRSWSSSTATIRRCGSSSAGSARADRRLDEPVSRPTRKAATGIPRPWRSDGSRNSC
jgi:hypothetical protein